METSRSATNRTTTRTAPAGSAWHNDATITLQLQQVLSGEGENDTGIEYFMRADLGTQRNVIATLTKLPIPLNLKQATDTLDLTIDFNNHPATRINQKNIDVRVYWWGYQVLIPKSLLLKMSSFDSRMELTQMAIMVAASRMVVPYVAALARMVADDYELLVQIVKKSEQIAAVDISACWLAPTTFVPSAFCNQALG